MAYSGLPWSLTITNEDLSQLVPAAGQFSSQSALTMNNRCEDNSYIIGGRSLPKLAKSRAKRYDEESDKVASH